jgi:shikimate kinase / 3-dehydroquinate synthase
VATALNRHVALIGFMGAGKSTLGAELAERLGRSFVDVDREVEQVGGATIAELFEQRGEAGFRVLEEWVAGVDLRAGEPAVVALGGGAVGSAKTREALRESAFTIFLDVDADTAWERCQEGGRPLARDPVEFRRLHEERRPLYEQCADAVAVDADDAVLAAGGVHVEAGSLDRLGELVPGDGPVALVADAHVAGIHGPRAQAALGSRLTAAYELPPGEPAKQLREVERLWRALRLDRGGTIVALGGGTATDAAGFAAATYLRGVPWVPVPTTLVGQVDAAIGGKTAIDLPEGKNLVGAFHWPAATAIDPLTLETLPEEQHRQGRAELVKTALLAGRPLDIRGAAAFKTAICLGDPHDRGRRSWLNLGHTFAHALEAGAGFELAHGDAVALGLLAALRLSGNEEGLREVESELAPAPVRVDLERAWEAMKRDKKAADGKIRLVLLPRNGRPEWPVELPDADVRRELERLIAPA